MAFWRVIHALGNLTYGLLTSEKLMHEFVCIKSPVVMNSHRHWWYMAKYINLVLELVIYSLFSKVFQVFICTMCTISNNYFPEFFWSYLLSHQSPLAAWHYEHDIPVFGKALRDVAWWRMVVRVHVAHTD